MYLAEKVTELKETWDSRNDVPQRAKSMLKIDDDIKAMRLFANRTYSNEIGLQKTVIRDLLGGESHYSCQRVTSFFFFGRGAADTSALPLCV